MSETQSYREHAVPESLVQKWQAAINTLARVLEVPAGLIMRALSTEIEVLVASHTESNPYEPREKADLNTGLYCETVMANRAPLHVPNALEDPQWKDNPDVKLNMISYFGMPLVWPDGSVFGTICVLDDKTRHYSPLYRELLDQFRQIIEGDFELLARATELEAANDRMKRDLDAAAAMQRDLLPHAPSDTLGARFAWHFEPCDELGGDILNILRLNDQYVAMYLLDVTGHGVPAALLSVTLSHAMTTRDPNSSILLTQNCGADAPTIRPPGEVLAHLNRQFPMDVQGGRFFTMVYGVFDSNTGLLRYANAGHPPPILARRHTPPLQLSGGSFPVGIVDDAEFEESSVQLQPGDRLYFYSDGITEAVGDRGKMLEAEGFIRLIANTRAGSLSEELASCIVELKHWCGRVPFGDDVSLLALEMSIDPPP